jgi:hypothetical protein
VSHFCYFVQHDILADPGDARYWAYKNAWSMDGLPGMRRGLAAGKRHKVTPIVKMVGPFAPKRYHNGYGFGLSHVMLIALLSFVIGLLLAAKVPFVLEKVRDVDLNLLRHAIIRVSS